MSEEERSLGAGEREEQKRKERKEEGNSNIYLYTPSDISGRDGLSRFRHGLVLFEVGLIGYPSLLIDFTRQFSITISVNEK